MDGPKAKISNYDKNWTLEFDLDSPRLVWFLNSKVPICPKIRTIRVPHVFEIFLIVHFD